MHTKQNFAKTLSAIAIVMLSSAASAATTTYNFGTYLTGSGPTTPGSFATLTIDSTDNKTFVFDLKVSSSLNAIFGNGAFVSSLLVNTASNQDPSSSMMANGNWGVSFMTMDGSPSRTGNVVWDYKLSFCGLTGGCNLNNADSRLTQGEEVKWTSTFRYAQTPLLASPGMSLKVQGYKWDGLSSASAEYTSVVSSVPEPETYAMLLAGLGLMAGVARRKQKYKAS